MNTKRKVRLAYPPCQWLWTPSELGKTPAERVVARAVARQWLRSLSCGEDAPRRTSYFGYVLSKAKAKGDRD
jgi:hypothetical protein